MKNNELNINKPKRATTPKKKPRIIVVKDVNSAKKLLSRVLSQVQRGEITESKAKTTTYIVTQLVSIINNFEYETKLKEIENLLKEHNERIS